MRKLDFLVSDGLIGARAKKLKFKMCPQVFLGSLLEETKQEHDALIKGNIMKKLVLVVCLLFFVGLGCGKRKPLAPIAYGPDTYVLEGGRRDRPRLLTIANEFCGSKGLTMMPSSDKAGWGGSRVMFRCLAEGDPDLKRPEMKVGHSLTVEEKK